MHPNFKLFVYFLGFILAAAIAVKPYNLFCGLTNKCEPFFFAYILPRTIRTEPIQVKFEITNFHEGLFFEADKESMETVLNKINKIKFHVRNNSSNIIEFRPELFVEPEYAAKFVERLQCLCSYKYKLRPNEEMDLQMVFSVRDGFIDESHEALKDYNKLEPLTIRYSVE